MGDIINDEATPTESGSAGAPEGAVAEPTTEEVGKMYKDLGVKAPVPTGKPKGRPKAADSGDKKASKKDDASGKSGEGRKADDSKDKPASTPASDSDGSDGDDADAPGKKVGSKDGKDGEKDSKISGDGDKDAEGVQGSKSKDNKEASESGEGDAEQGADGAGQGADDESDPSEEGKDDEKGKRPGKSSPEAEKRIQKLNAEKNEALERAKKAEEQLQETARKAQEAQIAQDDPEYTVDDFRKVRDREGNIIDLDPERAELAYRRWKDGYDQRASEREAKANREAAEQERSEQTTRQLMQDSADAYDALSSLMDEYPELVSTSDKFDTDFAAEAMPIINEAIQYLPGTEPGNEEGKQPMIIGLKINPKKILAAMKGISSKKRSLPLNGVNDNVESKSNVSVPHSRSSDSTVNAANDLYKELGINKRI